MIAVIGMRHFSSLDLVPSRMAGSFAAVSGADVGSASDMPIAVKLLYLDDLVLTSDQPVEGARRAALSWILRTRIF